MNCEFEGLLVRDSRSIEFTDDGAIAVRGRIVEQGSHQALLARGGMYAQLYRTREDASDADFP